MILRRQYQRVLASGESQAILYCTERRVTPKDENEQSQEITYDGLCPLFPEAVISTYNGDGIMARIKNPRFQSVFQRVAKDQKPKPKAERMGPGGHWQITNLSIADFYEICRQLEARVVVTIVYDLAKRGISFVSSGRVEKPIAATTMIVYPGIQQNAVAGIQAVGRISGTARPDLPRFLYAHKLLLPACLSSSMDRKCVGLKPRYAPQKVQTTAPPPATNTELDDYEV